MEPLAPKMATAFPTTEFLRADPATVRTLRLATPTDSALTEIGLPDIDFLGFRFRLIRALPRLADVAAQLGGHATGASGDARCFGNNYNHVFGIDVSRAGQVIWVDVESPSEQMFVNSDAHRFAHFLAEVALHWQRCVAGADPTVSVAQLKRAMERLDPPALNGWWDSVIEQLEVGLI